MRLIKLHPKQSQVVRDEHRFKIVICGRRFGKTTLAITMLLKSALEKPGKYWYVAPTYRQAKQIAWDMLKQFIEKIPWTKRKMNETELSLQLVNGSKIELKGADNEESLRGVGLDGVIMDEYAQIKPRVFEEIIRPTLTDTKGWAWFVGTPKGFNHFYDLYNTEDKDYAKFHFTSFDNPHLDKEEIEKAKEELTESAFQQEYLAKFTKFTGLVYPDFERSINVIDPIDLPVDWTKFRSIDFGFNNPTAILWFAINHDGEIYLYDEYYQSGKTTKEISELIKGRDSGSPIRQTFGDPSGKQLIADYEQEGIHITPANSDVQAGISKVSQYIKAVPASGNPRLFIFRSCINTIREFETYRWQEKREGIEEKEQPVKENDHAMDAVRYMIHTYTEPMSHIDESMYIPQQRPLSKATGY